MTPAAHSHLVEADRLALRPSHVQAAFTEGAPERRERNGWPGMTLPLTGVRS